VETADRIVAAMAATEQDLEIQGLTLRLREAGDPSGAPVMHFHGTPGCRLELAWGDDIVADEGVRIVAFDRPGYGGSSTTPFSLSSVAAMAVEVADRLGFGRFRTTGLSGGGPFALATALAAGDRVEAVGISSGAGPFQLVPGTLDQLSEGDRAAERLLPEDRAAAAAGFVDGFDLTAEVKDADTLYAAFEPVLSESDRRILRQPRFAQAFLADVREAVRQGVSGCGWDNVAWIGRWDVDITQLRCPVLLWYGTEDLMAPPAHAYWLEENIPNAKLTMRAGEGHLGVFEHLPEMLRELLAA
jgi:pimeloyl-ACP methyl ester carboxylesterase